MNDNTDLSDGCLSAFVHINKSKSSCCENSLQTSIVAVLWYSDGIGWQYFGTLKYTTLHGNTVVLFCK